IEFFEIFAKGAQCFLGLLIDAQRYDLDTIDLLRDVRRDAFELRRSLVSVGDRPDGDDRQHHRQHDERDLVRQQRLQHTPANENRDIAAAKKKPGRPEKRSRYKATRQAHSQTAAPLSAASGESRSSL